MYVIFRVDVICFISYAIMIKHAASMIMSWYHINGLGRRISHRYNPASFVAISIGPYHPVVVPAFDHVQNLTTDQTNVVYPY